MGQMVNMGQPVFATQHAVPNVIRNVERLTMLFFVPFCFSARPLYCVATVWLKVINTNFSGLRKLLTKIITSWLA